MSFDPLTRERPVDVVTKLENFFWPSDVVYGRELFPYRLMSDGCKEAVQRVPLILEACELSQLAPTQIVLVPGPGNYIGSNSELRFEISNEAIVEYARTVSILVSSVRAEDTGQVGEFGRDDGQYLCDLKVTDYLRVYHIEEDVDLENVTSAFRRLAMPGGGP